MGKEFARITCTKKWLHTETQKTKDLNNLRNFSQAIGEEFVRISFTKKWSHAKTQTKTNLKADI